MKNEKKTKKQPISELGEPRQRVAELEASKADGKEAVRWSRIWLPTAGMFVVLCILVWLDEILDLPHLLLGTPPTPVNWQESTIETVIIVAVGLFVISRLIHDVAEHQRAQEVLKETEESYRSTLDNMLEGCQIIGYDWRYLYVNDAAARHGRRGKEELLGRTMMEMYPGIENTEMFTALQRCMEKRIPHRLENEFTFPDGSNGWFELSIEPAPEGIFILSLDITERKRAEKELIKYREDLEELVKERTAELERVNEQFRQEITERKRAEEATLQLAAIVETSDDAIIGKSVDGTIVSWNQGAERIYGYSADEVRGKPMSILAPPGHPDEIPQILEGIKRGEHIDHFETVRVKKDGREVYVSLTISPVKDASGKITGASTIARDITERKKMQEQLARKERLAILGQLAGGVSHELRNPLGVISNAVYYLQTVLSEADETTREYLKLISSEVRRGEKIVSDLLDFARVKAAEREEITVRDLVTQVLDRQPPPEEVKVTTKIAPDLPPLFVDPQQISQVLVNLVTNAYDAMPQGGELTIKAQARKDKVGLSITDTGCGVPQENIKRLFEPLFSTKARGIGLGLAVSKNLVEVNGGSIEAESKEGKGSTFTVILPTKEVKP